jgi:hypothetical protein
MKKQTILPALAMFLACFNGFAQQPNPERNAYFGETHVHTSWSLDAFSPGNIHTTPADSYNSVVPYRQDNFFGGHTFLDGSIRNRMSGNLVGGMFDARIARRPPGTSRRTSRHGNTGTPCRISSR